jgi:hypothetical protein
VILSKEYCQSKTNRNVTFNEYDVYKDKLSVEKV